MKLNICIFLIKDEEFLEKCNKTWDKASNSVKKRFDSEPVYNDKYLKINSNFHDDDDVPKEMSHCICYK